MFKNLPFIIVQLEIGWKQFKAKRSKKILERRAKTLAYDFRGLKLLGDYLVRHETTKEPVSCPCEYATYHTVVYATKNGRRVFDTQNGFEPGTSETEMNDLIKAFKENR